MAQDSFDMDHLLNQVAERENGVTEETTNTTTDNDKGTEGNSEPEVNEPEVKPTEPTHGTDGVENPNGDGENANEPNKVTESGAASEDGKLNGTEPKANDPKKANGKNKKEYRPRFTQLEKAEFKAGKWKDEARRMRDERNAALAELERYKSVDSRAFANDDERMQFYAWKASQEQRVNDLDERIASGEDAHNQEIYEAKVADNFSEDGANQYHELDSHYGNAFAIVCKQADPENVIVDFLAGSKYEPAMRNVIYKNGLLQEDLFQNVSSNPSIAAQQRLRILERLEHQVEDFYKRQYEAKANKVPAQQNVNNAPSVAEQIAAANANKANAMPNNVRRFVLPSRANVANNAPAQAPQNVAPKVNVAPKSRQVTGSLTRGSEPGGVMDERAEVSSLMKSLGMNF